MLPPVFLPSVLACQQIILTEDISSYCTCDGSFHINLNSYVSFDIEYKTYGQVASKAQENESRFYWQHPTENLALHLVFDKNTGAFIGINCFGIRLRHELLDKYLREEKSIDYVLEHFNDLNFDPEFYKNHFPSIIEKFNKQFGKDIKLKKKSWKRIFQLN